MDLLSALSGRPAIYARFSSSRQDERSIDDQVRRCREHLGDYRGEVVVYADYAVSGAGLNRPGFESLMAAVDAGLVTSIITEDISRISRDFADAAQIFKKLQYARVPLIGVADGIDTSQKHAKLTFTLKSLVADLYLDDLRDKTLRGLEGRMLAGFATGRGPFGYRTRPELDAHGREIGKKIEIVDSAAKIVVRIFTEYANGRTMAAIARSLNHEGISSPRIGTRHRWSGWCVGTVREMLRNERYIGVWRFKEMQWVKVPGSNRRLPRKRPPSETMVREAPDLRIIELPLWEAVKARMAKVAAGRGGGRGKSTYLLSGVLICADCGAGLTIVGSGPSYYYCPARKKGICSNFAALLTKVLVPDLFHEIGRALEKSPRLRQAVELQNGQHELLQAQIDERDKALDSIEEQIDRLLKFITDGGEKLDYVVEKLRRLEVEARLHKAELDVLRSTQKKPRRRISAKDVLAAVAQLPGTKPDDIQSARLRLRRWTGDLPMRFDGNTLTVTIVLAALARDVAHNGAPLPSYPEGEKLVLRLPVAYLCARPRDAAVAPRVFVRWRDSKKASPRVDERHPV
jgi:DNA invertase Pin-like site-specific DNA recombinase